MSLVFNIVYCDKCGKQPQYKSCYMGFPTNNFEGKSCECGGIYRQDE